MTAVRPVCLPPRRLQVLLALHRLSRPTPWGLGYPPSHRELMSAASFTSTSNLNDNLCGLERAGLAIKPPRDQRRSWRVNYDRVMFETEDGVMSAWEYVCS
ncbi:hypothetical protein LCGC14_1167810 [marine sediment metagenome]|uniref:LexA repressor DNA-binding domain-containing protein n=1 Tax=marine sediment metagenome TaxID=412755 RepID=A0A0F9PW75_9ZZZZ